MYINSHFISGLQDSPICGLLSERVSTEAFANHAMRVNLNQLKPLPINLPFSTLLSQ